MILVTICGLFAILWARYYIICTLYIMYIIIMYIIILNYLDNFRGTGIGVSFYGGKNLNLELSDLS